MFSLTRFLRVMKNTSENRHIFTANRIPKVMHSVGRQSDWLYFASGKRQLKSVGWLFQHLMSKGISSSCGIYSGFATSHSHCSVTAKLVFYIYNHFRVFKRKMEPPAALHSSYNQNIFTLLRLTKTLLRPNKNVPINITVQI